MFDVALAAIGFLARGPRELPDGWELIVAPDLAVDTLQFFRVTLSGVMLGPLVVVNHWPPVPSGARAGVIGALQLPDAPARVTLILSDSEGSAAATSIPGVEDFVVAAAVAAVKVIAGWDESETIDVTVDERRVAVVMRLHGRTWQASPGQSKCATLARRV